MINITNNLYKPLIFNVELTSLVKHLFKLDHSTQRMLYLAVSQFALFLSFLRVGKIDLGGKRFFLLRNDKSSISNGA
jgi:hypothetical protein